MLIMRTDGKHNTLSRDIQRALAVFCYVVTTAVFKQVAP
jgi:hypothetical protein